MKNLKSLCFSWYYATVPQKLNYKSINSVLFFLGLAAAFFGYLPTL